MSTILVSGLINLETTLRVEGFPIPYAPVHYPFFGVRSSVSGVGYNVAKALGRLGHTARLLALIGRDTAGGLVRAQLARDGLDASGAVADLDETAQSVILYDGSGRRQIHVDLKDIQERMYPPERFAQAVQGADLAVLCNINHSRPFLAAARAHGLPVATDVHAIADLDDAYNRDFMAAADILFMSDERLPCAPEEWLRRLWDRYAAEIVVVGLGARGALLGVRSSGRVEHIPAAQTRPVVNTIGAGDALFSSFLHGYLTTGDAPLALRQAVVYASYKIGETGAADGLLDAEGLARLYAEVTGSGAG